MPKNAFPTNKTEYLFIDAGHLNHRLKDWSRYFNNEEIEIDFYKLVNNFDKVFYYDGVPDQDGENSRIHSYLNTLREIPNFHVYTGRVKGEGGKKRQKQVDILIAVHMLTHTIRNNMTSCTLLAGDEDFKPLVDALIQEGMNVTIWTEKDSSSDLLLYAADRKRYFTIIDIWNNCTDAFLSKYPTPTKNYLTPVKAHQVQHNFLKKGFLKPNQSAKRDIYHLEKTGDSFIVAFKEENHMRMTQLTFLNEEKFNLYFKMQKIDIEW